MRRAPTRSGSCAGTRWSTTDRGPTILVTYNPLCDSAVVSDRDVDDEILGFGVSGLVLNSNPLLYDRRPEPARSSLWSQLDARAVAGPCGGDREPADPAPRRDHDLGSVVAAPSRHARARSGRSSAASTSEIPTLLLRIGSAPLSGGAAAARERSRAQGPGADRHAPWTVDTVLSLHRIARGSARDFGVWTPPRPASSPHRLRPRRRCVDGRTARRPRSGGRFPPGLLVRVVLAPSEHAPTPPPKLKVKG